MDTFDNSGSDTCIQTRLDEGVVFLRFQTFQPRLRSWWFSTNCWWVIQISDLTAFNGGVLAYHGSDGSQRTGVRFWRGGLRKGYHLLRKPAGAQINQSWHWEEVTRNDNTRHPCLVIGMNKNFEKIFVFTSINWRASLVPAAAVIPAPIAYVKVVAVKKLASWISAEGQSVRPCGWASQWPWASFPKTASALHCVEAVFGTFSLRK